MELSLYLPVSEPINQSNLFGTPSNMYTALGQKGHPGLDFEAPSGTPLYSPCDGEAFYTFDKNGGDGLWIRYPNNNMPQYSIILWHMYQKGNPEFPFQIATDGSLTPVKAGQLLGYTDNSGYPTESTGSHLHLGVQPCDQYGNALNPQNGYLGCVDPQQFLNGQVAQYAQLHPTIAAAIQAASQAVQAVQSSSAPVEQKQTFLAEIQKVVKQLLQEVQLL